MPILAKDWYDSAPDYTSFYQGDIIHDVPVIFLPDKISKWLILRPNLQGKKLIDEVLGGEICKWFTAHPEGQLTDKWQYGKREEYVAAKAQLMNVALLTQTCDIERRSYYQIAPLYPEAEQQAKVEQLRKNELNYAFYLPAFAPYIQENSYLDFAHTTLIPKAYFPKNTIKDRLSARLSEVARRELQDQLKHYFSRPFGFGLRDKVLEKATFACVTCFYSTGKSVLKEFDADVHFTPCDSCTDTRWIRPPNVTA